MAVRKSPEPRRNRKRSDRSEVLLSFLPQNNPRARIAYIAALFGLIPALGLLLGPVALLYGLFGLRAGRNESAGNGVGHAIVSIFLGVLETAANAIALPLVARGLGWI